MIYFMELGSIKGNMDSDNQHSEFYQSSVTHFSFNFELGAAHFRYNFGWVEIVFFNTREHRDKVQLIHNWFIRIPTSMGLSC